MRLFESKWRSCRKSHKYGNFIQMIFLFSFILFPVLILLASRSMNHSVCLMIKIWISSSKCNWIICSFMLGGYKKIWKKEAIIWNRHYFATALFCFGRNFGSKCPDKIDQWFSSSLLLSRTINRILVDSCCFHWHSPSADGVIKSDGFRCGKNILAFETVLHHQTY